MRTFKSLLRWLSAGTFALIFLLAAIIPAGAEDTGTYQITNYIVTLEPRSNGQVRMIYEQTWRVLTGHIPWITVGLPNSNYQVESYSEAASKVAPANSGSWYGVRADLDKDYQPGESFTVKFTVLQGNLLERLPDEGKWRINYTPGWYDRARTDHLQINLISPVDYQTYISVSPMPTSISNNIITWERPNLSPGGRLNIIVESTDGSFLTEAEPSPAKTDQGGFISLPFIIIIVIILVIGFLVFWSARRARKARDAEMKNRITAIEEEMAQDEKKRKKIEEGFEEYIDKKNIQPDEEGRYYDRSFGNYITPAIWAAVILNQGQRNSASAHPPSSSCACVACACACACACAGGGGAGCARKSFHRCQKCDEAGDNQKKY